MKILQGDALTRLRKMDAESVQCVVTSPPYWGLRQYFFDKASVVRDDITAEEKQYVATEIARLGIKPRL
jgi:DNA modification methylase